MLKLFKGKRRSSEPHSAFSLEDDHHALFSNDNRGFRDLEEVVKDVIDSRDSAAEGQDSDVDSMETINDNPGTGRIIDKYIYQKFGRMLEKKFQLLMSPLFF